MAEKVEQQLASVELRFARTQLGEGVFIPLNTTGAYAAKQISAHDWSSEQLRAIADYIDKNPESTETK